MVAGMSLKTKYDASAGFLAGRGVSRRVMFGRGALFVLLPIALGCVLAIIYNGSALLFNVARDFTHGPVPRLKDVTNDLLMIGFSVFGMFCEIAGLNFFRMMEKKFDFTTLLAVMVGLFNVLFILMFGTLGLVGAVDLIRPGARIGS
jgi:hypothetical protein